MYVFNLNNSCIFAYSSICGWGWRYDFILEDGGVDIQKDKELLPIDKQEHPIPYCYLVVVQIFGFVQSTRTSSDECISEPNVVPYWC